MVPLGQGDAGLLSLCLPLSGLRPTDLMVLFGGITALGGGGGVTLTEIIVFCLVQLIMQSFFGLKFSLTLK